METKEWIRCPVCSNKTRLKIREDTILKNFPLFCPKCKQESLINAKKLQVTLIKMPDKGDFNAAESEDYRKNGH